MWPYVTKSRVFNDCVVNLLKDGWTSQTGFATHKPGTVALSPQLPPRTSASKVQMTDTVLSTLSVAEVRQGLASQQDQQDPMEGFRSIFISDALSIGALKFGSFTLKSGRSDQA